MPPRKRTEPSTPDAEAADVPTDLTDSDPEHMTDAELADATEQAAVDAGSEVRLAVTWPHDSFTVTDADGTAGLEITADGTSVPADREKDIRAEAKAAGVTIRKVN